MFSFCFAPDHKRTVAALLSGTIGEMIIIYGGSEWEERIKVSLFCNLGVICVMTTTGGVI